MTEPEQLILTGSYPIGSLWFTKSRKQGVVRCQKKSWAGGCLSGCIITFVTWILKATDQISLLTILFPFFISDPIGCPHKRAFLQLPDVNGDSQGIEQGFGYGTFMRQHRRQRQCGIAFAPLGECLKVLIALGQGECSEEQHPFGFEKKDLFLQSVETGVAHGLVGRLADPSQLKSAHHQGLFFLPKQASGG